MEIKIQKQRMAVILTVSLLVSVIVYFSMNCFILSTELRSTESRVKENQADQKTVFFTKLFISKVLLQNDAINFEDRLKLENAVRDLDNPEIFVQWQKFVASKNDAETQKIVGTMLKMLVDKISF